MTDRKDENLWFSQKATIRCYWQYYSSWQLSGMLQWWIWGKLHIQSDYLSSCIHPSIHPIAFSIRCLLPSTPVLKNQIESTIYCAKSEKVTTLNELSGIPPSKWCILMILEKLWKCKMLWLTSELLSIQWNRASLWLIFVKHSKKRWPKRYLESLGNSDSGSVSTEYLWWT